MHMLQRWHEHLHYQIGDARHVEVTDLLMQAQCWQAESGPFPVGPAWLKTNGTVQDVPMMRAQVQTQHWPKPGDEGAYCS